MEPQGHSPAELVPGPQQPHEPGSLCVNGSVPSLLAPCSPCSLAIPGGAAARPWLGVRAQAGEPTEAGRAQVPASLPGGVLSCEEGSLLPRGSAFSGLSSDAQLGPSSSVGWHQPRFSVRIWRQHCHCTPATRGLKLAWQAENLHGRCLSAFLGRMIQALGAKMSEQISECEHQAVSGGDGNRLCARATPAPPALAPCPPAVSQESP